MKFYHITHKFVLTAWFLVLFREPTSRTEGLTDLAAIMDERPKQNKALKNLGLYDEEDFGGEYVSPPSRFFEVAYEVPTDSHKIYKINFQIN